MRYLIFIAVIFVIVSHVFPLSAGNYAREWLSVLSSNQLTMGRLAVAIFSFIVVILFVEVY